MFIYMTLVHCHIIIYIYRNIKTRIYEYKRNYLFISSRLFSSSFSLLPIFSQLSPSILSTPASSSIHHYQKIFVCFSSSLSLPFPIYFIALLSISSIPDFSFAVSLSTQFYHFIFSDSALAEKYSPTICSFPLFLVIPFSCESFLFLFLLIPFR